MHDDDHYFETLYTVMALVTDNWTEKYADTQGTMLIFILGAVDEIEVWVVFFSDEIMAEAEQEAQLQYSP